MFHIISMLLLSSVKGNPTLSMVNPDSLLQENSDCTWQIICVLREYIFIFFKSNPTDERSCIIKKRLLTQYIK